MISSLTFLTVVLSMAVASSERAYHPSILPKRKFKTTAPVSRHAFGVPASKFAPGRLIAAFGNPKYFSNKLIHSNTPGVDLKVPNFDVLFEVRLFSFTFVRLVVLLKSLANLFQSFVCVAGNLQSLSDGKTSHL